MQATKFELVINAEIPRILGLTVPPTLLATSKRVAQRSVVYRVLNALECCSDRVTDIRVCRQRECHDLNVRATSGSAHDPELCWGCRPSVK
jgi:hypothetical protein